LFDGITVYTDLESTKLKFLPIQQNLVVLPLLQRYFSVQHQPIEQFHPLSLQMALTNKRCSTEHVVYTTFYAVVAFFHEANLWHKHKKAFLCSQWGIVTEHDPL
jgi:hypothetical protein